MSYGNTKEPTSRTFDKNIVDYANTIRQVHNKNVADITMVDTRSYPGCMRQKPLLNPIPNILNMKVTRTYHDQYEEECTPRRPLNNHYPLPANDVLMQRHIPMITH